MRAIFRVAGVIAAGVLIHSHHIYGQAVTGTIMGAVVDPTRAMVPGAQVTVRSVDVPTALFPNIDSRGEAQDRAIGVRSFLQLSLRVIDVRQR